MLMYISCSMPPMLLVLFYSRLLEKQHVDTHTHTLALQGPSQLPHMTWELRCAASVWAGPRDIYGNFHQHTLWDEQIWDWEKKRWKENIRFRTHRFSSVWILLGSGLNFPGLVFGMLILPISLVKILKFRPQVHETGSRYNRLDWRWLAEGFIQF